MKKNIAILLSAMILLSVACNAFASNTVNRVYADAVTVESGESITIPVKIENNNGFMGFAVIVTYDESAFTPVSASKSSMLSGLFNDSIETTTDNSFKAVYTGTGNVTSDGVLFNVVFDVTGNASGKYEIELSYSQPDTFNESWEKVELNCEKIETVVTVNGTTAAPTTVPVSTTNPVTTKPEKETTRPVVTAEPTTKKPEATTVPGITTTESSTEAATTKPFITDPDVRPKLTTDMLRDWVDSLPSPWNWLLRIPFYFAAFIVSLFE